LNFSTTLPITSIASSFGNLLYLSRFNLDYYNYSLFRLPA
jgi:hypothetical protein